MATSRLTLQKALPYILLIGGIIGYICAFIIMWDKVKLAQNPNYKPSCSLNPIISCGSVMKSSQAHVFGFPNPFIGLGAYPVIAVVGGAMLAGGKFKKWFWRTFLAVFVLGMAFAYWLLFQSVFRIHALCPFCLTVDVVTTIMFWYLGLYIFDRKFIKLPAGRPQNVYAWVRRHHLDILLLWFIIVIVIILKHFWYYYGHYL